MSEAVSIIIPAFNEESGIGEVLESIQNMMTAEKIDGEIIVVDDGSTDKTAEVVAASHVRLIQHETNRGYGATLKTGIRQAKHDLMLITDADGTYPVEAIPVLLAASGRALARRSLAHVRHTRSREASLAV